MSDLWLRLRQRKLVQWAVAYVAAAFALLQGVDIVAQQFGWSEGVRRGITLALVVGFFVTLILAWYHGERGEQKVSGTELLLLALLLAIGGGLLWRFTPGSPASKPGTPPPAAGNADRHSIAVLPFVNMSGDKNNEYFSDGVSEEILNVLAEIPQLKVAARTSSFSFKDSKEEVPQIARDLGVRMVLEGSVRKQGDRVRITAQLIDASTGFHLWSQTYDRELQDIFAIQDEIANAIAHELEVRMSDQSAAGHSVTGTTNVKAYDLYLRGIALWQTRDGEKLWQAIALFEQAVAADPKFAQGYAGLALVYAVIGDYSNRMPYSGTFAHATDAAERALALDPLSAEAYAALGNLATIEMRRETADLLMQRSIALRPSFATAIQWRGLLLMSSGKLREGLAALEQASTLDPRSLIIADNHALALRTLGRDEEAKQLCLRALALAPDYAGCLEYVAMVELQSGRFDAARAMLERLAAARNPGASAQGRELVAALAGHGDRHALALRYAALPVASAPDSASGNALQGWEVPGILMLLGESDLALGFIERQAATFGGGADWTIMLPAMDPIRCDPRFVAVVAKLNTTDPHYAKVCKGGGK